jgi:5-methylcytosine-specific restriction enzyme subunit McrC
MKACVLQVERHTRAAATQRKLAELHFLFAEVSEVPRSALPWRSVRIDRTNQRWRALFELARLLLGEHWQQTHVESGAAEGMTLLFPMNDLFERYVAIQMRRALAGTGLEVVTQGGHRYCLGDWREGEDCVGNRHSTRPDLLVRRGSRVIAVIDTKWKRLANGIVQADVYQMMAYARLYRCARLMLLYPHVPGEDNFAVESYGLSSGPERLDTVCVPLALPSVDLKQALRALIEETI